MLDPGSLGFGVAASGQQVPRPTHLDEEEEARYLTVSLTRYHARGLRLRGLEPVIRIWQ